MFPEYSADSMNSPAAIALVIASRVVKWYSDVCKRLHAITYDITTILVLTVIIFVIDKLWLPRIYRSYIIPTSKVQVQPESVGGI